MDIIIDEILFEKEVKKQNIDTIFCLSGTPYGYKKYPEIHYRYRNDRKEIISDLSKLIDINFRRIINSLNRSINGSTFGEKRNTFTVPHDCVYVKKNTGCWLESDDVTLTIKD